MNTNQTPQPATPSAPTIWSTWHAGRILTLIIALQAASFTLQGLFFGLGLPMFPAVGLGGVLGVLVPIYLLSRQRGLSLTRDFGLAIPSLRIVLLSAAMAVASLVPMSLLGTLSVRLKAPDPWWIEQMTENMPQRGLELVLALITVSLIAPLAEELIFRGLLLRLVRRTWGIPQAAVISALVFAIIHGQPWFMLGLVGVGLLLAFVYQATGSVLAAAVCHMVYNGVSLLQMTVQDEPFAVDAPVQLNLFLWGGVSLVAMVFIGRRLRQKS